MSLDPRRMTTQRHPYPPAGKDYFGDASLYSANSRTNDSNQSVITLEDSLNPSPEFEDEDQLHSQDENEDSDYGNSETNLNNLPYDLPTHISSHYDVLNDSPRTQTPTPTIAYREAPAHPLRALTADIVPMVNLSHDLISTSPLTARGLSLSDRDIDDDENELTINSDEEGSIGEEARILNAKKKGEWDEKGAAILVKKSAAGLDQDEIIKKSVKDFKFGKTLGVGSYSTVLLATDKNTERKFAVKVLDKRHIIKEKKVKYVNIEKNTLKRLGKRNGIVHMFFAFQDESSLYFVLDYAEHGELLNLIKEHGSINEDATRYYAAQLLDAIKFMHDNGVVHRDLKPENILLDSNHRLQVTDFGTAKLLEKDDKGNYPPDTRAKSFVGTAEYVSPELLNEKAIGKSCDIWAYGCIIYQMIAGKPPFKATNEYLTFQKIVKLQYAFTAGFPMVIRDLVKRILKLNPKDRLTIKEIQDHHFFKDIDFNRPDEYIWNIDPPEISPYKINAKSMLPVPELANQRSRITIPRRAVSQPPTPKVDSSPSITDDSELDSTTSLEPSASQKVLMKAKAKVAARKQQQLQKQVGIQKRSVSSGNAASAASIALSRQPNDIIKDQIKKSHHESSELKSPIAFQAATFSDRQEPLDIETLHAVEQPSAQPQPSHHNSHNHHHHNHQQERLSQQHVPSRLSSEVSSAPVIPPMTQLDLELVDFLKNHEERVLKKDQINVTLSTVDNVEKKFKGRLVDSPLGSANNKSSSSLLSQVAKGSYRGLRDRDLNGVENDKSIITNHSIVLEPETPNHTITGNAKSRFKKLFSSGSGDDSINNKRNRTIAVTSLGRFLIFETSSDGKLNLKTEVDLAHPVIRVKELLQVSTSRNLDGLFIIESYNTAFVFEGSQSRITSWTKAIHKARLSVVEKLAQKKLEHDPSGGAGTILGSDAAKSAASIATVHSPPSRSIPRFTEKASSSTISSNLIRKEPSSLSSTSNSTSNSTSKSTSSTPTVQAGILRDFVRSKDASRHHPSVPKELPNKGQLFHGLPVKLLSGKKSNANSDLLIAAASAAALSTQQITTTMPTGNPSTSSFNENTHQNISNSKTTSPKIITGMNSRMLSRSHDRRKKK